ncbi:MAG: fibronectin type III domain-containing protein [Lewinellaceae bacterium]|nr:fibronectin type III domain-containing protein [Lewinellaceae bacterium]
MAKKFLFSLLFCIHFGDLTNLFALNSTFLPEKLPLNAEECHAPPPDSFRMTAAGAHFVSLAWQPVWIGATHTLVVLKLESDGVSWLPIDTFPTIPGDSFTVNNLLYGSKYRFAISTKCANGDPSDVQAFTGPPSGLILDLVLNGRTPINLRLLLFVHPSNTRITIG